MALCPNKADIKNIKYLHIFARSPSCSPHHPRSFFLSALQRFCFNKLHFPRYMIRINNEPLTSFILPK